MFFVYHLFSGWDFSRIFPNIPDWRLGNLHFKSALCSIGIVVHFIKFLLFQHEKSLNQPGIFYGGTGSRVPSLFFDLHRLGSTCETSEECSNRGRQECERVNYGMFRRNAPVNSRFSESIFSKWMVIEDEVKFAQPNLIVEFSREGDIICWKWSEVEIMEFPDLLVLGFQVFDGVFSQLFNIAIWIVQNQIKSFSCVAIRLLNLTSELQYGHVLQWSTQQLGQMKLITIPSWN